MQGVFKNDPANLWAKKMNGNGTKQNPCKRLLERNTFNFTFISEYFMNTQTNKQTQTQTHTCVSSQLMSSIPAVTPTKQLQLLLLWAL